MNNVRSLFSAVSDSWISDSECGSSALVGSSSTSTSGSRRERTREADPLLLAAGDGVRARPDDRVIALRPADDVLVDARQARGALDRLVIEVAKEADVVRHRRVQQARFLRHVGHQPVPVLARELLRRACR